MNKLLFLIALLLSVALAAPEDLLHSKANISLLKPLQESLQDSSVVIENEQGISIGYGILVSADGDILTKASTLPTEDPYTCRIGRQQFTPTLVGQSREWDVALLKVSVTDGDPVVFNDTETLPLGEIVVSNGVTSILKRRIKFGIISAHSREIPVKVAALDFQAGFDAEEDGFITRALFPEGKAQEAGLEVGDRILSIDGTSLNSPDIFLSDLYAGKWPEDIAELVICRNGKEKKLQIPYSWRYEVEGGPQDRNEAMSGRISGRRTGFPKVLQHDIPLTQRTVGGPLLNLKQECIGMNIARFSRSETYAIPAKELREVYEELKKE